MSLFVDEHIAFFVFVLRLCEKVIQVDFIFLDFFFFFVVVVFIVIDLIVMMVVVVVVVIRLLILFLRL